MKHSRIIAMIMALVMVFTLTACGGETTPDATVNENPTEMPTDTPTSIPTDVCADMGHAWVDATCEAPKTCSVCGETEGEALGHIWTDANYQQPKTCETCGATDGEPLVSYFAEHGLMEKLCDKTVAHNMTFPCYDDNTKTTIATVTINSYEIFASNETHEAVDGYEWIVLSGTIRFTDENAVKYGVNVPSYIIGDIYDTESNDSDDEIGDCDPFGTGVKKTFMWNNTAYTEGLWHIAESITDWMKDENGNQYRDFNFTVSIRVPVGYDGFVFGLENYGWEITDGAYLHDAITDNTLLFRMD